MKKSAALVLLFSFWALKAEPASLRSLSPVETQVSHCIQKFLPAQLDLLETLVNINSGTENQAGVVKVGKVLEKELNALGFKTRWAEEPASMHRAGTLIAQHTGNQGKRLLLIGHLDTVFPASHPFQRFERFGNTAKGPGVLDDKGGDVVLLFALKALHAAHALEGTQITVVLTGDEEDSGKPTTVSRKPLMDLAKEADVALDFECSISPHTATIARRGINMWTIYSTGHEAHSAEIFKPQVGNGAIFQLAQVLNSLRLELENVKDLSFNPGLVLGGTYLKYDPQAAGGKASGRENVIAKQAIASGDIRFSSEKQKNWAIEKMTSIVSKALPGTTSRIEFQDGIPAMSPTEANKALLTQYSLVSENLGQGKITALPPGLRGAGDISHIAAIVPANLAGLGALGNGPHSKEESLDIASLTMQTQRAALLILRLIKDNGTDQLKT